MSLPTSKEVGLQESTLCDLLDLQELHNLRLKLRSRKGRCRQKGRKNIFFDNYKNYSLNLQNRKVEGKNINANMEHFNGEGIYWKPINS